MSSGNVITAAVEVGTPDHAGYEELASFMAEVGPRHARSAASMRSIDEGLLGEHQRYEMRRADGTLAVTGIAAFARHDREQQHGFVSCVAAPDAGALGDCVADAALAWFAARSGIEHVTAHASEDRDGDVERWLARDFAVHARHEQLALDLTAAELPPAISVDGVEVVTLADRPDLIRDVYELWHEGVSDIPGVDYDLPGFEDWKRTFTALVDDDVPQERREAARWVVLDADGTAVGYTNVHFNSARPGVAAHGILTVRRGERGRGIGRLLKHHAIRSAAALGLQTLETDNESDNHPIRHINASLGYTALPAHLELRRYVD